MDACAAARPRVQAGTQPKETGLFSRRRQWRTAWLKLHLYLGLSLGLVVVIIGLTGSLLVVGQSLDHWLNPTLFATIRTAPGPAVARPLSEIIAAAKAVIPRQTEWGTIGFSQGDQRVFTFRYRVPSGQPERFDDYDVLVDAGTATVTGVRRWYQPTRPWAGPLLSVIMYLHVSLLLDQPGATAVGYLATILFLSIISGLILWWPSPKRWKQAFSVRRSGGTVRMNRDVHNVVGALSALVLFMLLFTGITMYEPVNVIPLTVAKLFSPLSDPPANLHSTSIPGQPPLTPENAAAISLTVWPDAALRSIELPRGEDGVFHLSMRTPGDINDRELWIDQYRGVVLHTKHPGTNTRADTFWSWLFPLHTGEAFGLPGRIVVFIAGLVPLILFITGLVMWRPRRRVVGRQRKTSMVL